MTPPDLLVAVPARNEELTIEPCLRSVVAAVERALSAGVAKDARIAVAAHRCDDDTAARAARLLGGPAGWTHLVLAETRPMPVGAVRTRLITAAMARPTPLRRDTWIFSTDADSTVPSDWVTATLAAALPAAADLVAGMTELADWQADEAAQRAYGRLIAAGLTTSGHRHVYAANLAVRFAAFAAVGGFPALPHGEEHGLLRAVRESGGSVLSTLQPLVRTSARMPGRAHHGLGALLDSLVHERTADD